jgi:hypothetical protein
MDMSIRDHVTEYLLLTGVLLALLLRTWAAAMPVPADRLPAAVSYTQHEGHQDALLTDDRP